jgi:cation transport ATPase
LGCASQSQVLFRHGEAIERLANVRALRFDKTGTLTTGVAQVADLVVEEGESRRELCHVAAALAAGSNHVFSLAVLDYLHALRTTRGVENLECVAGRGLRATLTESRQTALLGSLRFAEEAGMEVSGVVAERARQALMQGESFTVVGWGDRVRGVFVFREHVRDEAREALRQCRALGLDLAVLTGDHAARGKSLARELDIPVSSELLPEEKLAAISRTQREIGPVAMIGDGVNDAPALAASDVGIALGCGADLTRDAAVICLTGNDLSRLPWAIDLARRTVRVIRQNLFWAFAYNVLGILLAAAGWLNPMWAAGAMVVSSLFVVVNSLRLRGMAATESKTKSDNESPLGSTNIRPKRPAAEAVA